MTFTSKQIALAIGGIVLASLSVLMLMWVNQQSDDVQQQLSAMTQFSESRVTTDDSEPVSAPTEPKNTLLEVIDPFTGGEGGSVFTTEGQISGRMNYVTVGEEQLMFSKNFDEFGVINTRMIDGSVVGEVAYITQYLFLEDVNIMWNEEEEDRSDHKWISSTEPMTLTAGSSAFLIIKTSDGGQTWTGEFRPMDAKS